MSIRTLMYMDWRGIVFEMIDFHDCCIFRRVSKHWKHEIAIIVKRQTKIVQKGRWARHTMLGKVRLDSLFYAKRCLEHMARILWTDDDRRHGYSLTQIICGGKMVAYAEFNRNECIRLMIYVKDGVRCAEKIELKKFPYKIK